LVVEQAPDLTMRVAEQEAVIAQLRGELAQLRTLPRVVSTTPGGQDMSKKQLTEMSYGQRVKFKAENPQLYRELTD
ncbi:MAG: hypothetical protein RR461_06080, partial [Angelakisella sp.]